MWKETGQTQQRREIVAALHAKLLVAGSVPDLTQIANLVDAVVCVLAGEDFIADRATNPDDRSLAEREGWIWAAKPHV